MFIFMRFKLISNYKTHKMRTILLILSWALFSISCSKQNDIDLERLHGTWIALNMLDKDTDITFTASPGVEITFINNECIEVIGPCNSGRGTYFKSKSNNLTISVGLTEMVCLALFPEREFADGLNGEYSIDNNNLSIQSNNNFELNFVKADMDKVIDCN